MLVVKRRKESLFLNPGARVRRSEVREEGKKEGKREMDWQIEICTNGNTGVCLQWPGERLARQVNSKF